MIAFADSVIKTEDLKLNSDFIHLNAESFRIIGKRWFDEFCRITGIDNRSEAIIKTVDRSEMSDLTIDKLVVKDIDIIHDESYDLDLETYLPIGKSLDLSIDPIGTN